ncbi:hypothetical protein RUM44_006380 [Polyplax serrata]|uniref:YEATS domain-containing protein n=1 Tax=Polyplax serrata TaxID=468196 RepID=A0ABR1AI09_POLSC
MEDNSVDKEKAEKIKVIVEKEIEKELLSKQNEVSLITEKIKDILRNLELLKYVVAVSYYDQNTAITSKKGQEEEGEDEKVQTQIHPCVKKLLPFRSNYNKSLGNGLGIHSYETRNSKKPNSNESKSLEIKKEPDDRPIEKQAGQVAGNIRIPQYVPPLPDPQQSLPETNTTRTHESMERFRVVVGNVSKWIPPDTREDNSTHKWMVYIRNKDEGKDVTKHLKKVRYFLHESYKPHDIIDVTAPFQLTRRGWGEFPIRIQLHFVHPQNKPIDIIHNLKLDMTCSGVQMLGAETVVDVCLYPTKTPNTDSKEATKNPKRDSFIKEEVVKEKQDVFDGSLLTSIAGFNSGMKEDSVNVKQEVMDEEDSTSAQDFFIPKIEEMKQAISNSRKYLLDRRRALRTIEIEHNYLGGDECQSDFSLSNFTKSVLKLDHGKSFGSQRTSWRNGLDPSQVSQLLDKRTQDRFKRMELYSSQSEEKIFIKLKNAVHKLEAETQSKYCLKVFRHTYLVNVLQRAHATKLKSVEALIRWFVQRWPIITKLSADPTYKMVHPYSCPSEEEFFRYSVGKQRSAEWFRAKAIQKVLKSLKSVVPIEEEIWSTKEIVLWSRFHGYFPSVSNSVKVKQEPSEYSEESRRKPSVKSCESSSDSEDGGDGEYRKPEAQLVGNRPLTNGLPSVEKGKHFKKNRKKDFLGEDNERPINYMDYNTCTDANEDTTRFGAKEFRSVQVGEDTEIEVVEVEKEEVQESPSKATRAKIQISTVPDGEIIFNRFTCETARQIGIKITEEEVIPGVMADSVSRVFSQSVSSFLEELVRRSCAQAWMRNGDRCPESIEQSDVLAALIEYPRFDIFTNRGLGQNVAPRK